MINNIITFFSQSSEDSQKTSATLTGILIGVASYLAQFATVIPAIGNFFNSPIGQNMNALLTAVGMLLGSAWTIFGLLRKVSNKIESKAGLRVE